jgi:hypothetical protein
MTSKTSVAMLWLLALGAFVTPADSVQGRSPLDGTADSLIGLWIDSVGGMEAYHGFQSASFTVTTVLYDTLTGRIKRSRPRYVWVKKGPHGEEARIERWESPGLIQQGFDGRATWAALDGTLLPDSTKDAREALYVARDVFYWFGLPYKLTDPGVYLRYLGLQQRPGATWVGEEGRPETRGGYHAVGVSFGEGVGEHQDVFTYYFPPGRGFPYEVTYVEEGKTELNRLLWGRTERAADGGYGYVVQRDWITVSGKRTKTLLISDVVLNPAIPQTKFERP